jgi:3-dehydroquinate synthase
VPKLFAFLRDEPARVLAREPEAVDRIIADAVAMKAEVVSADEREGDLRRVLNLGHTFGHALEVETGFTRFLHGEAVAWGMRAAAYLGEITGHLSAEDTADILETIDLYGPIPSVAGISAEKLYQRLAMDKKTVRGKVHFVVPERIGSVKIISDVDGKVVLEAMRPALA